jgi:hypothetical protein
MRQADRESQLNQMDEETQLMAPNESDAAALLEETATELRQSELENDLAEAMGTPIPETKQRRRKRKSEVERAMKRLQEARKLVTARRRDAAVQHARDELSKLLKETAAMAANNFDVDPWQVQNQRRSKRNQK